MTAKNRSMLQQNILNNFPKLFENIQRREIVNSSKWCISVLRILTTLWHVVSYNLVDQCRDREELENTEQHSYSNETDPFLSLGIHETTSGNSGLWPGIYSHVPSGIHCTIVDVKKLWHDHALYIWKKRRI